MTGREVRSVYMTFPDQDSAVRVARELLDEEIVACANIFPGGRSLYLWQGEIVDEPELVMIAKTTAGRLERLVERVRQLHPYDVPCIVALAATGGDAGYLSWIKSCVGRGGDDQ